MNIKKVEYLYNLLTSSDQIFEVYDQTLLNCFIKKLRREEDNTVLCVSFGNQSPIIFFTENDLSNATVENNKILLNNGEVSIKIQLLSEKNIDI